MAMDGADSIGVGTMKDDPGRLKLHGSGDDVGSIKGTTLSACLRFLDFDCGECERSRVSWLFSDFDS